MTTLVADRAASPAPAAQPTAIDVAVARLDRWLDSMHAPGGYGGPVVHFWRDNLLACPPAIDWRYEGIVAGYLALHRQTGDRRWLVKAKRAGADILAGRLPGGTFRNSGFELNPSTGGRPHEAAVDCALLMLAAAVHKRRDADHVAYVEAARENIDRLLIGSLWSAQSRRFNDGPGWFVPNKAGTILEALCLLSDVTGDRDYVDRYARPTADAILRLQVRTKGDALDGGIAQAEHRGKAVEQYFPFYVARAVSGLLALWKLVEDDRYLEAAVAAHGFLARWQDADGAFPQVVYRGGRVNRYPRWVAGAADMVRCLDLLKAAGVDADSQPTLDWILAGQTEAGSFRIAEGFASQASQLEPSDPPDARDLMPVVGWNDKVFRVLAERASGAAVGAADGAALATQHSVSWFGRLATLTETAAVVEVSAAGAELYRWRKGTDWASLSAD